MKIGKLAEITGISRSKIRFYESRDMIVNVSRPFEWNNYKDYGEENIKRIQIINYLQQFSFTLKEIKALLDERDLSPDGCIDKNKILQQKLKVIDKQIEDLQKTKCKLLEVLSSKGENNNTAKA